MDPKIIKASGKEFKFVGNTDDPYYQHLQGFAHDLPRIAPFVQANIPADGICLDVGANIGLTAVLLSSLVPAGHVFAFEALPNNARFLRANLELNGIMNCTVINKAVGAQAGVLNMTDSGAGSHMVTSAHMDKHRRTVEQVPVTTLDEFVLADRRLPKVSFVKMDVEGFEPAALAGGKNCIEKFRPPILMEFNSWSLAFAHGFDPFTFARAIFSHFNPGEIEADGSVKLAYNGDVNWFLHENMVNLRCVTDILLRLPPEGLVPTLDEMTTEPELLRLRADLAALRASTCWRVTAPLRALRSAVDSLVHKARRRSA